jgi:acyl dehydratase
MATYDGEARITDEAIEKLRSRIGVVRSAHPWASQLTYDITRHYVLYCLASNNPLWLDYDYAREHGHEAPVPPPTAEYVACSADTRAGGTGLPGIFALHAGDEWLFSRPAEPGERVDATFQLLDVTERQSQWGGRAVWDRTEVEFRGAGDGTISRWRQSTVRAERRHAREQKKYVERGAYRYSDEEIQAISAAYLEESVRGDEPRYLEDVSVGDSIGQVVKGPLTVMDLMCWWIGAGGPYVQAFGQRHRMQQRYPSLAIRDLETNVPRSPEDAHFDVEYAKRSGVGAMYDIGKQRGISVVHLATNWCGDDGALKRIAVQYRTPVRVGDTSWYRGTVSGVDLENGMVTADVTGTLQTGEVHMTGVVDIVLPRRPATAAST